MKSILDRIEMKKTENAKAKEKVIEKLLNEINLRIRVSEKKEIILIGKLLHKTCKKNELMASIMLQSKSLFEFLFEIIEYCSSLCDNATSQVKAENQEIIHLILSIFQSIQKTEKNASIRIKEIFEGKLNKSKLHFENEKKFSIHLFNLILNCEDEKIDKKVLSLILSSNSYFELVSEKKESIALIFDSLKSILLTKNNKMLLKVLQVISNISKLSTFHTSVMIERDLCEFIFEIINQKSSKNFENSQKSISNEKTDKDVEILLESLKILETVSILEEFDKHFTSSIHLMTQILLENINNYERDEKTKTIVFKILLFFHNITLFPSFFENQQKLVPFFETLQETSQKMIKFFASFYPSIQKQSSFYSQNLSFSSQGVQVPGSQNLSFKDCFVLYFLILKNIVRFSFSSLSFFNFLQNFSTSFIPSVLSILEESNETFSRKEEVNLILFTHLFNLSFLFDKNLFRALLTLVKEGVLKKEVNAKLLMKEIFTKKIIPFIFSNFKLIKSSSIYSIFIESFLNIMSKEEFFFETKFFQIYSPSKFCKIFFYLKENFEDEKTNLLSCLLFQKIFFLLESLRYSSFLDLSQKKLDWIQSQNFFDFLLSFPSSK